MENIFKVIDYWAKRGFLIEYKINRNGESDYLITIWDEILNHYVYREEASNLQDGLKEGLLYLLSYPITDSSISKSGNDMNTAS